MGQWRRGSLQRRGRRRRSFRKWIGSPRGLQQNLISCSGGGRAPWVIVFPRWDSTLVPRERFSGPLEKMERSMLAYSLARGPTLTPLIERTIGDVFDAAVEKWPAREAVVSRHERERYSYSALQGEVNRLASALLNLGLLPGDRIGIRSHNNTALQVLQLATPNPPINPPHTHPTYRPHPLQ